MEPPYFSRRLKYSELIEIVVIVSIISCEIHFNFTATVDSPYRDALRLSQPLERVILNRFTRKQ